MRPETKKHLFDVRMAIEHLESFAKGRSQEDYVQDAMLQAAVERKFLVIGEALARLRTDEPEVLERISEWRQIIKFRNVIVHGYDVISPARVWQVVMGDLPRLRGEVTVLLEE